MRSCRGRGRRAAIAGVLGLLALAAGPATGQAPTLVLPFRTVGVSDTTAAVVQELLSDELKTRGVALVRPDPPGALPDGAGRCDDSDCAAAAARQQGAVQVVYGSLSRLGEKVIVRVRALHVGDAVPFYSDQISALTEEDLDTVMRRIAEGIARGRTDSDRATIDSVTGEEERKPRRRAGRSGIGLRAGAIFPSGDSYSGERLASLRLVYKFESRDFLIESTALLGVAWGGGSAEWMPLDVFAARIFGTGDLAGYAGAGAGLRSLRVERRRPCDLASGECYGAAEVSDDQFATTLSFDVGGGLILFRTYSYQIVFDLRYHHVFEDFDRLGGHGAHGLVVSFGTSH